MKSNHVLNYRNVILIDWLTYNICIYIYIYIYIYILYVIIVYNINIGYIGYINMKDSLK